MITSFIILNIDWAGGLWYSAIMNLTVHIPDDLARRITAAGVNPEHVALEALRQAAEEMESRQHAAALAAADEVRNPALRTPAEAAARIIARRKGVTLGGFTIKELINEGRA
jgi:hypothetical protein